MRRHLEGIDLATTPALLRRATVIDDFAVHSNAATTHALLRRTTTALLNAWRNNLCYNSRSLLRRATPLAVEPLDDALATTHALLRRATTISAKKICVISLQLTLSCGERLSMVHSSFLCYGATTRALLRRATL